MTCPHWEAPTTPTRQGLPSLGSRRFRCRSGGRRFHERSGTPLNDRHYPTDVVLLAVLRRLRDTRSCRDSAAMRLERGCSVTPEAIRAWPRRFARRWSASSGATRPSQARIGAWRTATPRGRSRAASSRTPRVSRRRQRPARRPLAVGSWRSVHGVPVRAWNRRRQARQRNRREPSAVRPFRFVVAVDVQSGHASRVPSPFRGCGSPRPASPAF